MCQGAERVQTPGDGGGEPLLHHSKRDRADAFAAEAERPDSASVIPVASKAARRFW